MLPKLEKRSTFRGLSGDCHWHQAAVVGRASPDVDEDVRQSIARIQASPFIPLKDSVRGFVYDVKDGSLRVS